VIISIVSIFSRVPLFIQFKEQRRKILFCLFSIVGIPVLCLFSIHHLLSQNYLEGIFDAGMALFLLGCYQSFKFIKKVEYIYLIGVSLLGLLFLYFVYDGGTHGSKLLWMYLFPLIAFFMLGRSYGLLFSAAALSVVGLLFFYHEKIWFAPYPYENDIKLRFVVTYSIVSVLTLIFEHVRHHFQKGMEVEHEALLEKQEDLSHANDEIRTLSLRDHLTGCFNRLFLSKNLPKEITRSERYSKHLSIIMCDIDYFKKVNDKA